MRSFLTKFPKWLLFSFLGAAGAALLCFAFEPIGEYSYSFVGLVPTLFRVGMWTGFICVGIALSLVIVQALLLTGALELGRVLKPVVVALGVGFLSGVIAQFLYSMLLATFGESLGQLPRFPPWMIAGAGLGLAMSLAIPNLRPMPAAGLGALGGLLGVSAFVVFIYLGLGEVTARLWGAAAIGFFVGLALAIAERAAREGFLRVIWAPNETTTVNLGARPITVGTGKEVSVRLPASSRYPALVATFRLVGGAATMHNHMSNTHHALRDGNRLNLGPVSIEVKLFS